MFSDNRHALSDSQGNKQQQQQQQQQQHFEKITVVSHQTSSNVLTKTTIKTEVFWDIKLCRLLKVADVSKSLAASVFWVSGI